MKNVMLYLKLDHAVHSAHESIMQYLQAQIDNSLHYGWNCNDIIIISNFDFEYRGVTNTQLRRSCDYNIWANKFYAIRQLIEDNISDDFWLHDYDVWQIEQFDFPKFPGMFAGCSYDHTHPNWNGGSFFFTKDSYPIVDFICEYYEINRDIISTYDDGTGPLWYSDELIINQLRTVPEIRHLFSSLTPEYNLGMSLFNSRYAYAQKPIKAIHAKLLDKTNNLKFKELCTGLNLIPAHLLEITNKFLK